MAHCSVHSVKRPGYCHRMKDAMIFGALGASERAFRHPDHSSNITQTKNACININDTHGGVSGPPDESVRERQPKVGD